MSLIQSLEYTFLLMGDRKVFVIYFAHRCVMDRGTMCSTNRFIRKTPVHSNVKPPGDVHDISDNSSKYIDFVAAFPRITETNLEKSDFAGKAIVYRHWRGCTSGIPLPTIAWRQKEGNEGEAA